jgi:hypothetical protein
VGSVNFWCITHSPYKKMLEITASRRSPWVAALPTTDILALNCPDFLTKAASIYDNELELEETFAENPYCFLDLDITLQNGTVKTNIYNKTDAFPFKVNRFGYPDSMVSTNIHSNTVIGQLIRYARICNNTNGFVSHV